MPLGRGALTTLLVLGVCAAPASAETHDIRFDGNGFSPPDLTVIQGDTVNFRFDSSAHTATSDEPAQQGAFDTDGGTFSESEPFSRDMVFPGEFKYHCKKHPQETGRIVVRPKPNDPNPPVDDIEAPQFATPKVAVRKREVRFALDEDARVTVKLRGPTATTIRLEAKAGPNVVKLPKKLRAGRYAAVVWATDARRNRSKAKTVKFRVR